MKKKKHVIFILFEVEGGGDQSWTDRERMRDRESNRNWRRTSARRTSTYQYVFMAICNK